MTFARPDLERRLRGGLADLSLTLPATTVSRLLDYLELLARWNRSYNLTAVRDPAAMVTRHLLDALAIAPYVTGRSAIDLGSGAGIPGLVLAITEPQRPWCLVDANGKKARFLRAAVRELELDHVRVAQQRVEAVRGRFDCVTARAFASLGDMLQWGGHLLAPDGVWLAMKGQYPQAELDALPAGFTVRDVHMLAVPGLDAERRLVCLGRTGAAP